jgi:hypothetical protein
MSGLATTVGSTQGTTCKCQDPDTGNLNPPEWIAFVVVYLLLLATILVPLLIALWPLVNSTSTTSQQVNLVWGWFPVDLDPAAGLFVLAGVAGALGAFLHAATSLADYVGNQRFVGRWAPWYVLRLAIGSVLAVLFYAVVQAGFFSGDASPQDVSRFGVVALGGLAGLFSKQATDKLREVFETLFKVDPDKGDAARADSLTNPKPKLTELDPSGIHAGSDDIPVTVVGSGFVEGCVVRVQGTDRETTFQDQGKLRVTLPRELLSEKRKLEVVVVNPEPGGGTSDPRVFKVSKES